MTNQEQAYFWLTKAQYWFEILEKAETRFAEAAKKGKITNDLEINYKIWSAAKENFGYQHAARQLKATQERATMYALFALLEKGAS